jgi:hypothetical protein
MTVLSVQVQDVRGNWMDIQYLSSATDVEIRQRMLEVSNRFKDKRVRVINTKTKGIVDIL